jgi:hypothetical protein
VRLKGLEIGPGQARGDIGGVSAPRSTPPPKKKRRPKAAFPLSNRQKAGSEHDQQDDDEPDRNADHPEQKSFKHAFNSSERFQEKCEAVFRFGNATKQESGAPVLI